MRLLHRNSTGQLCLTEDLNGDSIPEYAILSHTWGPDMEEVTFEDVINGTSKDKPGYKKIQFCGEQARQNGLQYFWIDTCCINKKNDAELSRAVNSMFRWYHNATRCYVYLSDVSIGTNKKGNSRLWESDFGKSRWFTRGWTLQELLAPRSVEFFSQERDRLGDKSSLRHLICEITNIPLSALQGDPLSQFSFQERSRWMQHRQTKREEDIAYSLLGIFDVYIFPIYGEGTASALARLKDEFDKMQKCIQELHLTDPRDDKRRIEDTKGGLLENSYRWVLTNSEFQRWRSAQQSSLLWIKGDPGKGKTMLLCGIINELDKLTVETALLSYFFCQANDSRINNATAVLRGLIYMLVRQRPSLVSYIQKKYNYSGKTLFEDINAWVALSEIFTDILQDPSLNGTYLIIDGLDECVTGLPRLLDFIVQKSFVLSRVKWIVSSRNWPDIEERLVNASQNLSLELNAKSVSAAVSIFIQHKVLQLAQRKKYNNKIRDAVLDHLSSNANGTFLWVALVCQDLEKIPKLAILASLNDFPAGLDALYERMIKHIRNSDYPTLCNRILALLMTVYRPVILPELTLLIDMPEDMSDDIESIREIIGFCGSFLAVRKDAVYFVHRSAKDYLFAKAFNEIFPSGKEKIHYDIFLRSLDVMSRALRRDIYSLSIPGFSIDQLIRPNPDPLAAARYSCLYWVDHLIDCDIRESKVNGPKDGGSVYNFLSTSYLYWLEALSLMKSLPDGIVMIMKLENWLQADESPDLHAFVHDARRFAVYNRSVIEQAPLQSYCSALIFAPEKSIIRETFEKCIPTWIERKPKVQAHWSAAVQTLEGHSESVNNVLFSPDSKIVASVSNDKTVRLWDSATGALRTTLKHQRLEMFGLLGLSGESWERVNTITFSPDGRLIATAYGDRNIRIWDSATGVLRATLKHEGGAATGHKSTALASLGLGWVDVVAFLPDGKQLLSATSDMMVMLWDSATGAPRGTIKPEGYRVRVDYWGFGRNNPVALSPDGKLIACASDDGTVRLWDPVIGVPCATLKHNLDSVNTITFSPDGKLVACTSDNMAIWLGDPATGAQHTLLKHEGEDGDNLVRKPAIAITFSPDGKLIASASGGRTVMLWDSATGALRNKLESHSKFVSTVVFSVDGKLIAPVPSDRKIKLWSAVAGTLGATLEGHSDWVNAVAFSPDGKLVASASSDKTVRLWDPTAGAPHSTPSRHEGESEGHLNRVNSVILSPDGKMLASASHDMTVKLWDFPTGSLRTTLNHKGLSLGTWLGLFRMRWEAITTVIFSPDSKLVASASGDRKVRIWDSATGMLRTTLKHQGGPRGSSPRDWVNAVAFSPDGRIVASSSDMATARLWDSVTGAVIATLEGHSSWVNAVAFSPDGKLVASASRDKTVRLWDSATGAFRATFESHTSDFGDVVFSPDGNLVASASCYWQATLWDSATGTLRSTLKHRPKSRNLTNIGYINSVTFSPDSKLVASATDDKTVMLWDSATGAPRAILDIDVEIRKLSFSSDGLCLDTDRGLLGIDIFLHSTSTVQPTRPFNIFVKEHWIAQEMDNILWLPSQFRAECAAFRNNTLVIGHASGLVTFFKFDLVNIPRSEEYTVGGQKSQE